MHKGLRFVAVVVLVGILAIIRAKGEMYFYDPLLSFFKGDYLYKTLPELNYLKLFLNLMARYFLNSIVSLAIIFVIFLRKDFVVFSIYVFGIGFVIFSVPYFMLIKNYVAHQYIILFYVRRILIHPLFILMLIPAFYYFKNSDN